VAQVLGVVDNAKVDKLLTRIATQYPQYRKKILTEAGPRHTTVSINWISDAAATGIRRFIKDAQKGIEVI
jgi:hypothetical protein